MDPSIDREAKLNTLLDLIGKIVYILDKGLDRHEDDIDVDYPEKPMLFPDQTRTQLLQDLDNEKYIDDDQDFIEDDEKGYRENNEEGCQEIPDCLPISCNMLLRELHNWISKNNSEQCFEETSSHLENAEFDVERKLADIGTLPLYCNSF